MGLLGLVDLPALPKRWKTTLPLYHGARVRSPGQHDCRLVTFLVPHLVVIVCKTTKARPFGLGRRSFDRKVTGAARGLLAEVRQRDVSKRRPENQALDHVLFEAENLAIAGPNAGAGSGRHLTLAQLFSAVIDSPVFFPASAQADGCLTVFFPAIRPPNRSPAAGRGLNNQSVV